MQIGAMATAQDQTVGDDAEHFWDKQYRTRRTWGERPNPLLVEIVEPLTPGSVVDLGCGPGGPATKPTPRRRRRTKDLTGTRGKPFPPAWS